MTEQRHQGDEAPFSLGDGLSRSLGFRINRLARVMKRSWALALADLDLTPPQTAVLRGVAENPDGALRALARVLGSDPMSTKRFVDELEARGLIASTWPESDRRLRTLRVTDEGAVMVREVRQRLHDHMARFDEVWSRKERERFEALLSRLETALGIANSVAGASPHVARARHAGTEHGGGGSWDEHFEAHGWALEPDAELVGLAGGLPAGRALDLGCANGRNSLWLAAGGWTVVGVDASRVGLEQFQSRANELGVPVQLVESDLTAYAPTPSSFDLIILANIHLTPVERDELFARAASALAPGGHLYVIGHHVDSLGVAGPPDPERLFDEDTLRQALRTLRLDRLERLERKTENGSGHPVVDVLAWATAPAATAVAR